MTLEVGTKKFRLSCWVLTAAMVWLVVAACVVAPQVGQFVYELGKPYEAGGVPVGPIPTVCSRSPVLAPQPSKPSHATVPKTSGMLKVFEVFEVTPLELVLLMAQVTFRLAALGPNWKLLPVVVVDAIAICVGPSAWVTLILAPLNEWWLLTQLSL